MRLSELISETRVTISAKTTRTWSDADIVVALNAKQRALVRILTERDEKWFNHTFNLLKAAARTQHTTLWGWKIPPWILKVTSVRQLFGGSTAARGPRIPRADKLSNKPGWDFGAGNELRLVGYSGPIDLEIECAKLPARMIQGTLPSQSGMTTSQMKLESDATAAASAKPFPRETALDFYAGSQFEITGPDSVRVGQLLRCVGNTTDPAGRILTMEEAWTTPPVATDTYEMHMEAPPQHARLLVLLASRTLFAQERNTEGLAAIEPEVNEEWKLFLDSSVDRDLTEPHTVIEGMPTSDYTSYPETNYLGEYL